MTCGSVIEKSLSKCSTTAPSPRPSIEEEETFDTLTSRFLRTWDILTQRVVKTNRLLLREYAPTCTDRTKYFAKLGVIASADVMIAGRDPRDKIANEYTPENLMESSPDMVRLSPELRAALYPAIGFVEQRFD